MTKQEFIFSGERKHRLARHIAFWAVWGLAFFLFFHIPQHAIAGWNLNEANANLRENGALWILKMMIVNVFLAVVLPQMLFTYTLLYYIVPNYFYQKRNPLVTDAVVTGFIMAYLFVSGYFKQINQLYFYLMGMKTTFEWSQRQIFYAALRDTLLALPIIAGLALAIKLMKRWWLQEKETQQIANEKIYAELQLLKAQVHPHFLFNTLNNIYFFALSGSIKAPEMIKKLSDMLHYILNECNQSLVPLKKEIKMIKDYISLERIRYGEQMDLSVELPDESLDFEFLLAPLLLIPFVENSFKHGASKMLNQPYINLRMSVENNVLHFFIANGCPPTTDVGSSRTFSSGMSGNIGLKNVKKRLQLLYPDTHELTIIPEPESFTVYLNIKLFDSSTIPQDSKEIQSAKAYERV